MFEVSELTLQRKTRTLICNARLTLAPGEVKGLVAPNGWGKTTLLRTLAGDRVCRTSGVIEANGVSPRHEGAYRNEVLYTPGDGSLLEGAMNVREHLEATKALWKSRCDIDRVAAGCGLGHALKRPAKYLSKGMKQQLTLAIAYATGVPYVLLDEPTGALDPASVKMFESVVRRMAKHGRAVLYSSHVLEGMTRPCDAVVFMRPDGLQEIPCNDTSVDVGAMFRKTYAT